MYPYYSLKQRLPTLLWISINYGAQQIVPSAGLHVIIMAFATSRNCFGVPQVLKIIQGIKSHKS